MIALITYECVADTQHQRSMADKRDGGVAGGSHTMAPPFDRPISSIDSSRLGVERDTSLTIHQRLKALASADRQVLYQLTMHCRDRGHAVAPFAKKRLSAMNLI